MIDFKKGWIVTNSSLLFKVVQIATFFFVDAVCDKYTSIKLYCVIQNRI